jgi:hypothetical protein
MIHYPIPHRVLRKRISDCFKATELTGQHRHCQANTVRVRVVLSTIFIGLKVIDNPRLSLRLADLLAVINCLDELIQNHCLSE